MERDCEALKKVNKEMREALVKLQETVNSVSATSEMLFPTLKTMVDRFRASRMTLTMEFNKSLKVMKEVRRFFLDDDYREEMDRLQEFVRTGERMKALIEDGTMEAVSDIAIKLAKQKAGG